MKQNRLIWRNRRTSIGNDLGYLAGMTIILYRSIRNRLKRSKS